MTPPLDPNKVGIAVRCAECGRQKKPRGRSAPMRAAYCDSECPGYYLEPHVGDLWPGESEADFGYYASNHGTQSACTVALDSGEGQ